MKVKLLRYPIQHDWDRCKLLALGTEGKEAKTSATDEWKHKMLKCEHSPIRTLMFTIQLVDVPYWVSVHYVRHKYGIEHYVRSQRNDRQSEYDRNSAPQNAPVNHIIEVNAQELMFMARKECIEEMIDKWGSELTAIWCEMTAYKYEYRAGLKDGNSKEQDMAKRDWYLHKAMEIRAVPQMTVPEAFFAEMPASMPATANPLAKIVNDAAEQISKQIEKSLYGRLGLNYGA